ncbi:SDR family NAD(P)-dependent oxidoreductase [Ramlibacter monticola]|uniref:SDR family oxidoreductase n=1 Tax=Ramlibacter monticola TaxID=1926872 RepID=A0A936Z1K9_9BURK|nr:SDR family NAD(P)-dependent oxidoreductase [Ramlibacter monticola]MBL0392983.1 SDR family oxidoreductase [Ramlibacter monticola]
MQPVAIVTGGASNIGWACAQRLAVSHLVVIADIKAPEQPLPPGMQFLATNVTQPEDCRALLAHAQALGPVKALVHSAAITAPARPVEQITLDEWRRVIDINLTGAFIVAQAAIPALRAAQGSMVMIASRAARTGVAALVPTSQGVKPHYCASKAGLLSLVKSLATELAADGIRVNAVLPGSIEGAMIPRERWPELAAHIPLRRLGLPEEIADAANFLCSAEARYITGHAMDVNGGTWMN